MSQCGSGGGARRAWKQKIDTTALLLNFTAQHVHNDVMESSADSAGVVMNGIIFVAQRTAAPTQNSVHVPNQPAVTL